MTVICPFCESDYSHQGTVEVFHRREDKQHGLYVRVAPDRCYEAQEELPSGNPSSRRQGVLIHVECEQCDNKFRIGIAQHKGQTFIQIIVELPLETENSYGP